MQYPINLSHLKVRASDGVLLPALHYRSSKKQTSSLAIYIHGSGSSSIIRIPEMLNPLANELATINVDFLAFNNRGAGYITKFETATGEKFWGGMSRELIKEFHKDITGVLAWAKEQGYSRIFLIGHSTGANKLVYELANHTHPEVAKMCLFGGGDDITLQRRRYKPDLLAKVEQFLHNHSDTDFVPTELFPYEHPISSQSLAELLTPGSDYDVFPFGRYESSQPNPTHFQMLHKLTLPVLFVYGEEDFGTIIPARDAVDILLQNTKDATAKIIPGGDHGLKDIEKKLADTVISWIKD